MPSAPGGARSTPPPQEYGSHDSGRRASDSPHMTPPHKGRPPIVPQKKEANPDVAKTSGAFQAMRHRWEQEARHKTPGGVDPQWFLEFSPKKYGTDSPSPRVSPGSSNKSAKKGVDVALMKDAFEKAAGENDGVPRAVNIPCSIMQVDVPNLQKDEPVVMPKPVWNKGGFDNIDLTQQEQSSKEGDCENVDSKDVSNAAVSSEQYSDASSSASETSVHDEQAAWCVKEGRKGVDKTDAGSEHDCGELTSEPLNANGLGSYDGMRARSPDLLPTTSGHVETPDQNDGNGFGQKPYEWSDSRGIGDGGEEEEGGTQDSSVLDIHPDAELIVLLEDTDMRPSPAELELDGEPDFMDFFGDGWDDESDDGVTDAGAKDTNDVLIVNAQGSLDSEGYVTTSSALESNASDVQPCDTSSVDFSIFTDPTAAETTAGASKRASQMPDIPEDASPLPDPDKVGDSGTIFARSSLRAIVMKKWHSSFWVKFGDASLLVFRSKVDFQDWLLNPYHPQRQRDYLVKVRFDFHDEMTRKSNIRGFRMTDIKLKTYERKGEPMYHFKLEKWTDLGMSIAAAFASPTIDDVEALKVVISNCLESCPHHGCRPIDDLVR